MSNYNMQYTNYYEELKRKTRGNENTSYSGFEEYLNNNLGYRGKSKKNKNMIGDIINTFILQMVGSLVLLLMVFGARYSDNEEINKYYKYLNEGINREFNYNIFKSKVEDFKESDMISSIESSFQNFKKAIETNALNN